MTSTPSSLSAIRQRLWIWMARTGWVAAHAPETESEGPTESGTAAGAWFTACGFAACGAPGEGPYSENGRNGATLCSDSGAPLGANIGGTATAASAASSRSHGV